MQIPPDDSVDWTPLMDEQRSEGCAARSLTPPRKRVARTMTAPGSVRTGGVRRKHAVARRPGSSSRFRGVTHHCRTGRWEAHIWEDGKQVYLGGFDNEEQAALAYDIAAIKFRAHDANTNYNISNYEQELLHFDEVSKEEVVQSLRKQSRGAQKTSSQYRGVTKHQKGKWEARIGQMVGRKYKYLGLYKEEIEAATAYDREAVRRRGIHAVTNFDLAEYIDLLDEASIAEAESRHLFKPKPTPADAVTAETNQGVYYTQAAQPMQHEGQQGFSDVQLVQTDLHHTSEENAVQNLQQYGSYTLGLHYTAVAKKTAPGDVSRHDTPTSVFDIFNALSIVHPQSPGTHTNQPTTDHHEPSLGQEPALTDIPHMGNSGTPGNYQAMIVEDDDDWLHDFALSQLQPSSLSAAHAVNSLDPEQSAEPPRPLAPTVSAPDAPAAVGDSEKAAEQDSSGEATATQIFTPLQMTFAICQSSIAEPAYRQPRRRENGLEFHPADVVPAGAIKVNNRKLQSRPKVSGARYSGIKGIYRRGGSKRWEVGIEGRGGRRHLSSVGTKEEAIQIYKRVAVKIGHADAECFFTKNPYKGQFLNLHQTPKEVLLAPLPWEIAVMMPTNSDTPSTFQMQLQPEHNTQCDRTHPQIGASRALQHYQLPHLEDNLEGFEGLPGSEDNALSALTGADYPRTEGQTHLSGPRAVTQYLPNGLKYTQVITCACDRSTWHGRLKFLGVKLDQEQDS
ncbi:hypothetical protein WJX79_005686 [Trebouxia sp. C0005]